MENQGRFREDRVTVARSEPERELESEAELTGVLEKGTRAELVRDLPEHSAVPVSQM